MLLELRFNIGISLLYKIRRFVYKNIIFMANKRASSSTRELSDYVDVERAMKLYGNSILRIGMSYMKNMEDAEDVLQDTMIRYYKNAPNFNDGDHEKAWLIRVSINIAKNLLKKYSKNPTLAISEDIASYEVTNLEYVWEAVKQLPVKYREVVHLYYHEGYSAVQIASILETKDSTIRSLLMRGRKMLKDILKEDYDFEE